MKDSRRSEKSPILELLEAHDPPRQEGGPSLVAPPATPPEINNLRGTVPPKNEDL
jgi:hypothetical protein